MDRYYVTKTIGEGTYGHVYIAKDLELERDVALKVLKKSRANRLNIKRLLFMLIRFYNERCHVDEMIFFIIEYSNTNAPQ